MVEKIEHISASASHYNKEAETYDLFNEQSSLPINQFIEQTLKQYAVNSVLDLSCGTGLQVFYLLEHGYEVIGVDINAKMLKIAKHKAAQKKQYVKFIKGDMRDSDVGEFDAVVTISNSIGHLTQSDFKKAIRNVYNNLKPGGLYLFDIFNLSYLLKDDNITKLTIDWQKKAGNTASREIQYSTINEEGILASYDIYHRQVADEPPKITKAFQTLQVYTAEQLKGLLEQNDFKVLRQCNMDGSRFSKHQSERIFTIAKRSHSS